MVGALAQLIERGIRIVEVGGLNPPCSTKIITLASCIRKSLFI